MAERITINQLAERVDTGFQVVKEAIEDLKTNQTTLSSTVPFTWAASDEINCDFSYRII